jgi:hypothetical protein
VEQRRLLVLQGRCRHDQVTRLTTLPNCENERGQDGSVEGRDPGGLRVLLANPWWEKRLLRFLELSGTGRVVANGEEEEEAWARRMDEWIVWEDGKDVAPGQ